MMAKMGAKELSRVANAPNYEKLKIVKEALKNCDIPLPKIKPMLSSQVIIAACSQENQDHDATNPFELPGPGRLFAQSGQQLHSVHCAIWGNLAGYHCISPTDALPWLVMEDALSKDELALLIFGEMPHETKRPVQQITVPCHDEKGQRVLIACNLNSIR